MAANGELKWSFFQSCNWCIHLQHNQTNQLTFGVGVGGVGGVQPVTSAKFALDYMHASFSCKSHLRVKAIWIQRLFIYGEILLNGNELQEKKCNHSVLKCC